METHLKFIGSLLILLALIHVVFPRYFNWKQELSSLSLANRQIMYVHSFFIAFMVLLLGVLCITSAADLVKLMMKYQTFKSLHETINISRATSLADTAKAKDGYNFDWCATDSTGDWREAFQFLGSSTIIMRSSSGFCCAILMNSFRPDSSEFFPDLFRIIKMVKSDSAL